MTANVVSLTTFKKTCTDYLGSLQFADYLGLPFQAPTTVSYTHFKTFQIVYCFGVNKEFGDYCKLPKLTLHVEKFRKRNYGFSDFFVMLEIQKVPHL